MCTDLLFTGLHKILQRRSSVCERGLSTEADDQSSQDRAFSA